MKKTKKNTKRKSRGENLDLDETIKQTKTTEVAETEVNVDIPKQVEFFKTPIRFGNIPVDTLPLGCDEKEQYRKLYPKVSLPFQIVERVSLGHPKSEPNKLIFGDNLHLMRMLPSNSIDLIYIDPPFFSGRNYNVVFGDSNEVRSFTDIWEGGMPGYLTWLNARLLEMKRLLKSTGLIYVHVDWHAAHYVKIELDKIFGYNNFRNEIIWCYGGGGISKNDFPRKHDVIFRYSKTPEYQYKPEYKPYSEGTLKTPRHSLVSGGKALNIERGTPITDWWADLKRLTSYQKNEWIGYPTQKPEELLRRIIETGTNKGDIVADFFCGGGTTPAVAQKLGRRWIASDISKIAVSVTRDRLLRDILGEDGKTVQQSITKVPDIEVSHWGVYEVPELIKMNKESFRNFIISAYNGRLSSMEGLIHGYKQSIPLFVGSPSQENPVTEKEVIAFAKEIVKKRGHHSGTMISWGFTPGAQKAAQELKAQHALAIDFVKIDLVNIESEKFREHVSKYGGEYKQLLKFILPPQVRISHKKVQDTKYEFDVSESVSLNPEGRIINVQWDFSYNGERFISTPGYAFLKMKNDKPTLIVDYKFKTKGKKKIACKVQDSEGGEKIEVMEIDIK